MLRLLLVLIVVSACSDGAGRTPPEPEAGSGRAAVRLRQVADGLVSPVFLTAPAGDPRLFILEQPGRIRVVEGGQLLPTPFLDISERVGSGGERGLLGLAFHPDYARNGLFFVNYTDRRGDTQIERYRASADRNRADPASARSILSIDQPYSNHNGGQVSFGPDGKLYIGMGDGGAANDPHGHGQNRTTLLGAMLRIDVDAGDPYGVPADNPFVGQGEARGEIWGYGLRNPWRFSFDRATGLLYIGDVGQNRWEEVHVEPAAQPGINYGWNVLEGAHCLSSPCAQSGMALPALEYPHSQGCTVIGGYVYRGRALPELRGHYFYADYCRGWIRSFRYADGRVTDRRDWELGDIGRISSFGEDAAGELYVISHGGRVFRLEPE